MGTHSSLLAVVVLALLVIGLQLPNLDHWNFADDFRNLQWAVEHRFVPWEALTERTALHGHVRPLTLIATWAGVALGMDPWLGVHAVVLGLMALALAGLATLTREQARAQGVSPAWATAGALTAVLLANALPGTLVLPRWNAWINAAGEVACGLWALVFLHRALHGRSRWLAPGVLAIIAAGLFREPGWLVAPFVVIGLAWGRRHRLVWLLGLGAVAALGMAFCWHPDNVARMAVVDASLWDRVEGFVTTAVLQPLDTFPFGRRSGEDPFAVAGIAWPLAAWALCRDILRRDPFAHLGAGACWLAVSAAGLHAAHASGPLVAALGAMALWRTRRAPPAGLLLFLAGTGAMFLGGAGGSVVQVWSGGLGVALYVAGHVASAGAAMPRIGRLALAALLLIEVGQQAFTGLHGQQTLGPHHRDALAHRAAFFGLGGLTEALDLQAVEVEGMQGALVIGETLGLTVTDERRRVANLAIAYEGETRLYTWARPDLAHETLLSGGALPLSSERWERSGPAGPWAIGLARTTVARATETLQVVDACGETRTLTTTSTDPDIVLATVWLDEGCAPLTLNRQSRGHHCAWRPFAVPLPQRTPSLWRVPAPVPVPPAGVTRFP